MAPIRNTRLCARMAESLQIMTEVGEFNRKEELIKEWRAYQRRHLYSTRSLSLIGMLSAILFAIIVIDKDIHLEWQSLSLLWAVIIIAALPLLSRINISKEGGGVDFADSLGIIDRLESSEAKAEAARGESFEQTRDQISALSLKVSEISATLLKLSLVQQPAELVSEHGDGNSPEQVEDVIAEPTAAREDLEPGLRAIRQRLPPPSVENDPQKGRFGGSASNDKRSLVATVVQSELGRKWFSVTVRLQSNDGGPLTGKYAFFFLHDTFEPDTYRVKIPPGALSVDFKTTSKGAFTIGVVADKGTTFLELDLASDAVSAPQSFKDY